MLQTAKSYKKQRSLRNSEGMYLIEGLVAMVLGAMLAFVLLDMLSQTLRITSSNNNRQNSDLIAQSVLDAVKRMDPNDLPLGTYDLLVNSSTSGEQGPAIHPLPVGLALGDKIWTSKSQGNKFPGQVRLDVIEGPSIGSKTVVVSIKWSDGSIVNTKKVGILTSVQSKGLNFWQ